MYNCVVCPSSSISPAKYKGRTVLRCDADGKRHILYAFTLPEKFECPVWCPMLPQEDFAEE